MNNAAKNKMLENVASERYGANVLSCDFYVVEWSAEHIAKTHGFAVAAAEWRRVNARRRKLGRYTTIPQFGTEMFTAFFAEVS